LAESEKNGGALTMTILEHLEELRSRLIKIFIYTAVGFGVGLYFSEPIFAFLKKPLLNALADTTIKIGKVGLAAIPRLKVHDLIYTGLTEAFFTYLKVGLVAGLFLAAPFILYQIWAFVSPALYKKEKTILIPVTAVSFLLFVGGAAFGYFVVFPIGFKVLLTLTTTSGETPLIRMQEYFSLVMWMLLAFGACFELPVIIFMLSRFGIVSYKGLKKFRPYALLGAFILGAILTPTPDPINQTLLAVPLYILYEVSIWVTYFFGKKREAPIDDDDETTAVTKTAEE
jgi:sec-independent protein translocase protein TatC